MKAKLFFTGVLFLSVSVLAQSGGQFVITQSVVAGGGVQNSAGGAFSLDGTIGQAVAGNSIVGSPFAATSGFWNFISPANQGFESDVAPRADGDANVQSNDVVQVQRFQIGLDQPLQKNELQRADSAPFSSRGDGAIQSNDVVQAQRYQIGLDAPQNAAGPFSSAGGFAETQSSTQAIKSSAEKSSLLDKTTAAPSVHRRLHVQNASGSGGQQVVVNILADADGDESAYGFLVTYNQLILTNPVTAVGSAGGSRLCNTTVAGRISCSVNNFPNNNPTSSTDQIGEMLPGDNQQLLRITFTIAANAPGGATPIDLTGVNVSNDGAISLTITSQNGSVAVAGPTAANVTVGGRVLTADGRGIRNARVILTAPNGETRFAQTGVSGFYRFTDVAVGQTYILTVTSKRFVFANPTRAVVVTDEIVNFDFVAETQ
jgi:hypothetical protein